MEPPESHVTPPAGRPESGGSATVSSIESFLFAAEARAGTSANAAAARTAAARKAALEDNYSSRLITCQPYGLFTGSYSAIPISPGASEKPTSPNAGTIRSRENSPGAGVTPEFASP